MNTLFLQVAGSRAYGTNRLDSDWDYRGVFIEPIEQILGSDEIISEIRNMNDITDRVEYGLKKFMKLTMNGNPNIIELWFNNNYVLNCSEWKEILKYREDILSQKIVDSYCGWMKKETILLRRKWDNKAAANTYRLSCNAIELFTSNNLTVKLYDASIRYFMGILNNEFPQNNVLDYLDARYDQVKNCAQNITWPKNANMSRINQKMYNIYKIAYEL